MEDMVNTDDIQYRPLYLIVGDKGELAGITFDETDIFYQEVPETLTIDQLSQFIDYEKRKIFWRDNTLIDEGEKSEEEIEIAGLKKQIGFLKTMIDEERANTQQMIFEVMELIT